MDRNQKARELLASEADLNAYEQRGEKPPENAVWGHYDLMDAFG